MTDSTQLLTTGEVADQLGIPRWRLMYLIERGDVDGPTLAVAGRRLFSEAAVDRMREQIAAREKTRAGAPAGGKGRE